MPRPVADNGGREFPLIERVMERKGQTTVLNILLHVMYAVNVQQSCEILPHPLGQGMVLGGKQRLLSAVGQLPPLVYVGVQAGDGIALRLILFGKLLNKFRRLRAVILRRAAKRRDGGARFFVDLTALHQVLQIIRIGHVIQISEFLPFGIAVYNALVGNLLVIYGVLRENTGAIQHGIDHHHDYGHHYANGANAK